MCFYTCFFLLKSEGTCSPVALLTFNMMDDLSVYLLSCSMNISGFSFVTNGLQQTTEAFLNWHIPYSIVWGVHALATHSILSKSLPQWCLYNDLRKTKIPNINLKQWARVEDTEFKICNLMSLYHGQFDCYSWFVNDFFETIRTIQLRIDASYIPIDS